jgi:membrane protease YdiL (CAAX protease family)
MNPRGSRLGVRVIIGYVIVFAAVWIATAVLGVGVNRIMTWLAATDNVRIFVGRTLSRGGMLAAVLLLSAFALRRTTGLRARDVMFSLHPRWWKDLVFGCGLSAAIMLVLFGIEAGAGWLVNEGWFLRGEPTDAWLRTLWVSLLANLLAAVGEEVMYRGYLLTGLSKAWGKPAGLLVMAILFALPHILVTGAEETHWGVFIVLLALPGLMLGWAYLRTRSLWLPIGIHFTWNLFQADVLNLPGDGTGESLFGLLTEQQGPDWIVGTSYGIEVGLAGVLAVVMGVIGIWIWTARKARRMQVIGQRPCSGT